MRKVNKDEIANLMRRWRFAKGLTQKEAGEQIGLSERMVQDMEQGRRRSDDVLTLIALEKLVAD